MKGFNRYSTERLGKEMKALEFDDKKKAVPGEGKRWNAWLGIGWKSVQDVKDDKALHNKFYKTYRTVYNYPDNLDTLDKDSGVSGDEGKPKSKVGDNVQWCSQGVMQFEKSKKIIKIEQDKKTGEFFYFFDGSPTGIPESEIELANTDGDISIEDFLRGLTVEDKESFEERAAIMEFEGGLPREEAEREALKLLLMKGTTR